MISSLLQNPANGGIPAIATVPIRNSIWVQGIFDFKAAHFADVLLAGQRMDDGAGRQKQQGLKKRMGHEVENRGRIGADARTPGTYSRVG